MPASCSSEGRSPAATDDHRHDDAEADDRPDDAHHAEGQRLVGRGDRDHGEHACSERRQQHLVRKRVATSQHDHRHQAQTRELAEDDRRVQEGRCAPPRLATGGRRLPSLVDAAARARRMASMSAGYQTDRSLQSPREGQSERVRRKLRRLRTGAKLQAGCYRLPVLDRVVLVSRGGGVGLHVPPCRWPQRVHGRRAGRAAEVRASASLRRARRHGRAGLRGPREGGAHRALERVRGRRPATRAAAPGHHADETREQGTRLGVPLRRVRHPRQRVAAARDPGASPRTCTSAA